MMLRRCVPLHNDHLYLTDSETESDDFSQDFNVHSSKTPLFVGNQAYSKSSNLKSEKTMARKAEKYQQSMKQMPIPTAGSGTATEISFISWQGLANFIKQKHHQPLHYLTHKLLREWDESRIGSNEQNKPLQDIIDPAQAEAAIWVVEQFHRHFSSPQHLTKLWLSDPLHQDFVDPIIH